MINMILLRFVFLFYILVTFCDGKVYTRCGLARELVQKSFPRSYISNWVCLIESESGKDTSKITQKANGSKSYGLFQINSKEWCAIGKVGGKCNLKCEDLINEDLTDDIICAKKVYNQNGFLGWDGWKRGCYGRKPETLREIFIAPCNPPI